VACNDPYHNPAGLKFVTRVEIGSADPMWPDALAYGEDRLIMNIPNGAGPGTVLLQTENCYMDWRIVGTKNLVRSTQRAYTGAASWEEVWIEDGANIYGRVQARSAVAYNTDGLEAQTGVNALRALWFPNGARIPTFDRLSLVSGGVTPAAPGGFPLRSLANGADALFAPPGLCRYFQASIGGNNTFTVSIAYDQGPPDYWVGTGANIFYGFCPAWANVIVTNTSGGLADIAVCWNRFPMTGN